MTNHKPDVRKSNVCPPCPPTASAWEKLIYWLGIGLGSGLPKRAAGTWGTVGGLVVAIPLLALGFGDFWRSRCWVVLWVVIFVVKPLI